MSRRVTLAMAAFCAVSVAEARVVTVCNNTGPVCPSADYNNIAAAVADAEEGDVILVWPGTYEGEQALVNVSNVTIRGMDRYGVLLHGKGANVAIQAGSKSEGTLRNVTYENMSATGYKRQPFYWENVRGYTGRYLHTWGAGVDDGGVYGIYSLSAQGEPDAPSLMANSYAYGYNDGGFYVGECSPCNVVLRENWSEWNALGYSGTDAGGNLIIEDSVWNDNIMGILPNTLHSEDHAPQRGAVIRNNYVYNNNNVNNRRGGGADIAVWGVGIGSAGGSANQIYGNTVYENGRFGIVTFWLFTPPHYNMVYDNVLWNNGPEATASETVAEGADLADGGPGSLYNCFQHNISCDGGECPDGPSGTVSTQPPELESTNACHGAAANFSSPGVQSPVAALSLALEAARAAGTFNFQTPGDWAPAENRATPLNFADDGSHLALLKARALQCMANPCEGLEDNAFCLEGEPTDTFQQSAECAVELRLE